MKFFNSFDKMMGSVNIVIGILWATAALAREPSHTAVYIGMCSGFSLALGIAHLDRAQRHGPPKDML